MMTIPDVGACSGEVERTDQTTRDGPGTSHGRRDTPLIPCPWLGHKAPSGDSHDQGQAVASGVHLPSYRCGHAVAYLPQPRC